MVKSKSATVRRRKTYRKKPAKKALTKAIKKVVNKSKPRREERFYVSSALDTSLVANSFENFVVSNISQGDQFNQRDGKKIYMAGLRFTLAVQNNSSTKMKFLRIMVVRNKNAQGVTLNTTTYGNLLRQEDFLDLTPTLKSADCTYPLNTGLLQIFFDKTYKVLPEAQGGLYLNRYVPIKRTLSYDSVGSGNVPTNGQIYVILHLCEGDDVINTTIVDVRGMIRVHYKDA